MSQKRLYYIIFFSAVLLFFVILSLHRVNNSEDYIKITNADILLECVECETFVDIVGSIALSQNDFLSFEIYDKHILSFSSRDSVDVNFLIDDFLIDTFATGQSGYLNYRHDLLNVSMITTGPSEDGLANSRVFRIALFEVDDTIGYIFYALDIIVAAKVSK